MPDTDKKSVCQEVRELAERHDPFWRQVREAMDQEEAFLDGDRYEEDSGPYNKDRRGTQIRGQEIQDTIRHIAAQATVRPRNIETRPIDRVDDDEAGEVAASLVERELSDPWKGFEDCYEAAIIACRERRLGIVWMDWEPDCGPFGELIYSDEDGRRYMWDPAYDPHHPMCGWLIRERRVDVDKARADYKAEWLTADREFAKRQGRSDQPLMRRNGEVIGPTSVSDNKVTIWECWYKNDKSTKYGKTEERKLKPDEQYMVCGTGCGKYRGEPGAGQPEMIPEGCPLCGGDLERVDILDETPEVRAFARGRRLVIMAPFAANPDMDKPLSDGPWPIPSARSFPGLFITAYVKPGRAIGPSDTYLMWDQQIASDSLRTAALQRVLEHRNYWVLPRTGIVDFRNKRFEFRDDQFNVMYRDHSKSDMGPLQVEQINGSGLDPQFSTVFGVVQQALTQYRGVADLGLTPDNSKNIAASTVEQLTAQGEIPTEHFNRRKNRALGKFYGVVWDYIRATYTPERFARLNIEGTDILANLSGDDLPNYDFVISDTPPFTGIEKQKADAARELIQMAQAMPDFLDIYAEAVNVPASIVRKIQKRMDEMAAKAEMNPDPMSGMGGKGGIPPEAGLEDSGPGIAPGIEQMGAL